MTLRVGLAGCGLIAGGPVRGGRPIATNHAAACRDTDGAVLVAAADPDAERRRAFGETWAIDRLYDDVATMLRSEALDIVVVATPPETHEAVCMAALEARVRGILCEKPMTGHGASAARVAAACASRRVPLVVNFARRWDVSHQAVAARIAAGDIGEVRVVHGTYTGTLRGNGSHLIDTLLMMAPGAWRIAYSATTSPIGDDGPVSLVLRTDHEAEAHLTPVRGAEYFVFELSILGTRGRVRLTRQGLDVHVDEPQASVAFPGYFYLEKTTRVGEETLLQAFPRALDALTRAVAKGEPLGFDPANHVRTLTLIDDAVSLSNKDHSP